MTNFDRGVIDYSNITDSYEMEIDNQCHFVDIQTAYEGGVLWRKPEQIVYNPVFGTNLENDPNQPTRDISFWNDTKTIQFITHNGCIEIWAPFREIIARAAITNINPAYCNLTPPNCAFNAAEIPSSELEVITMMVESTEVNPGTAYHPLYSLHIHKPRRASATVKRPVVFLVPGGVSPGNIFDVVEYATGTSKAEFLASCGYVVVHWDADGRGNCVPSAWAQNGTVIAGGVEDYNGYRQQDGFAEIIRKISELPYVDTKNMGILAYGFGLSLAVGAVARNADCNDLINYIVDHEGLVSRIDIGNCGGQYATDIQHDCTDDSWWNEREAIAHVAGIKGRYLRIQYEGIDVTYYEFIRDYMNFIVTEGTSPWVRINDNRNALNNIYGRYDIPFIYPTGTNIIDTLRKSLAEMVSLGVIIVPNDIHVISYTNSAIDIEVSEGVNGEEFCCGTMSTLGKIPLSIPDNGYNKFTVKTYTSSYGSTDYTTPALYLIKKSFVSYTIDVSALQQTIDVEIKDVIYSTDYQHCTDYGIKQISATSTYTAPMELTVHPRLMLSTFIDAVKSYGYVDPTTGKCEFPGNLAYLCYGRALRTSIETLHGSSKSRLRHNINCLLMSEVSQRSNFGTVIGNHLIVQRFSDPFVQLNGDTRQLKKVRTNVTAWKPLVYSMRISPDLATVKPKPLTDTTSLITMKRNKTPILTMEFPIRAEEVTETLACFIEYSPTNPIPPSDISMYIVGADAAATAALPAMHMKMVLYKDGKIPLCIYYKPDDLVAIPITSGGEIPLGTMGWGMRMRFTFVFDNPTNAIGQYKYIMRFKSTMPSTFGDACFGDYFHFTEYVDEIPLQLNVTIPLSRS